MADSWEVDEAVEEKETWYVICEMELLMLLQRAHDGEDPAVLVIEAYVNSDDVEDLDGDEDSEPT